MPSTQLYATIVLVLLPACTSMNALAGEDRTFKLAEAQPADGAKEVPVTASLSLRFSQPVAAESLNHLTLHRIEKRGSTEVAARRATDLTNASITLSPEEFLAPNAVYEIRGSALVRRRDGTPLVPFRSRFTTGPKAPAVNEGLVFTAERFDDKRSMTTVLFGPDHRLYAADAFGTLVRWDIDNDGKPINKQTLLADANESRQYIDLEWDPQADADNLILWASYGERLAAKDDRHYFTGTIARLKLGDKFTDKISEQVVVSGLPHGREKQGGFDTLPHQPNGLVFKDGKLYQSVGSTSSSGGPANWGLPEQVLSGCVLEIDVSRIQAPLDVHPKTGYDPYSADAPVRIFATGVRNALELVAHSNGRLYTATNINDRAGRADGVPDDPEIAGDQNALVTHTTPNHESLYLIERGRHYGLPNPARKQYVLAGGNPTASVDPFEIPDYPVGTRPEDGFAPDLMYPLWQHGGTSPNGMIEYLPSFPHPLRNTLLCCFYSAGDIAVMPLGPDGMPTAVAKLRSPAGKLRFTGPLDITMDPSSGILYIADFGLQSKFGADGSMIMLRPAFGH
jgi:hypothetical protein